MRAARPACRPTALVACSRRRLASGTSRSLRGLLGQSYSSFAPGQALRRAEWPQARSAAVHKVLRRDDDPYPSHCRARAPGAASRRPRTRSDARAVAARHAADVQPQPRALGIHRSGAGRRRAADDPEHGHGRPERRDRRRGARRSRRRALIRVGTCGAIADGLELGELVVAGEALATDGTSRALGRRRPRRRRSATDRGARRRSPRHRRRRPTSSTTPTPPPTTPRGRPPARS